MIILNNWYEIQKTLEGYCEHTVHKVKYVGVEKIELEGKDNSSEEPHRYTFYVVRFMVGNHELIIYMTGQFWSSVHISCDLQYMQKAKEELEDSIFDFIDTESEDFKEDNCFDFRDRLDITINTYGEDIIEANFEEDNEREMEQADWDNWRKFRDLVSDYISNKISKVIGGYIESGVNELSDDWFNWNFSATDEKVIEKSESLADLLHGSKLDEDTNDPIYNQIIIYERDWLSEALKDKGIEDDNGIANIVESIVVKTPKGHPLYFMLGGIV
jgi:hypothetical protein